MTPEVHDLLKASFEAVALDLARILTRFANEEWNGVLFPKLFSNSIQPTILTDRELVTVEQLLL